MTKQLTALLFSFAFLVQTFNSGLIYLGYYIDSSSYLQNCINKDHPLIRCGGKCQVIKRIEEQEKKEQAPSGTKAEWKTQVLSSHSCYAEIIPTVYSIIKKKYPAFNDDIPLNHSAYIFHPPDKYCNFL